MATDSFNNAVSHHIWDTKYRNRREGEVIDHSLEDTWHRVARALASVENEKRKLWEQQFYDILKGFKFLPGGRILAGAGTPHNVTLLNCFVMGIIKDTIPSIFESLKEGALTMQQGGGIGYDFSTLRPKGSIAKSSNNISSGPISFMKIWDAMCATMLSTGARRGAMMATLRCDHPDIIEFVKAKQTSGVLTNFNLSVLITDRFMKAIEEDVQWQLIFPIEGLVTEQTEDDHIVLRQWSGSNRLVPCKVMNTIKARTLWQTIMKATYDYAEPGVLFVDQLNTQNNLGYCEQISATNPCGEVPLPPYGACDLGSLNLTQFVKNPFSRQANFNMSELRDITKTAVRMLDNVIDLSLFPLKKQEKASHDTRRIGLGITGLADTLIMLGLHYGSKSARAFASRAMKTISETAYSTSVDLAKEKKVFPLFQKEAYLTRPFIRNLPAGIQNGIAKHGIRNSHLISIAPTGSISILANNVSSGLEPVFEFKYDRKILDFDGSSITYPIVDFAYQLWQSRDKDKTELPDYFVCATELSPKSHLAMQAALQPYVDNSISKTINIPEDFSFELFEDIYRQAYTMGLKGCTTFRPNLVTGAVLEYSDGEAPVHCCSLEREAD